MSHTEYPGRPRVAVGGIVFKDNRVLLVRRGNPPAEGQWSIPGGSVELGETLQQAVEREIHEEAGIVVRAGEPIYVFDTITQDGSGEVRFHYVIVDLAAEFVSGELRSGDDAQEARWVSADELTALRASKRTVELLAQLGFVET